jgi:hypothetical protein
MARVDDSIDFGPRKPYRRYPWDQWTNGETWVLTQGEDFDVTVDSFLRYRPRVGKDSRVPPPVGGPL